MDHPSREFRLFNEKSDGFVVAEDVVPGWIRNGKHSHLK